MAHPATAAAGGAVLSVVVALANPCNPELTQGPATTANHLRTGVTVLPKMLFAGPVNPMLIKAAIYKKNLAMQLTIVFLRSI
jgi:hypothetical protein